MRDIPQADIPAKFGIHEQLAHVRYVRHIYEIQIAFGAFFLDSLRNQLLKVLTVLRYNGINIFSQVSLNIIKFELVIFKTSKQVLAS